MNYASSLQGHPEAASYVWKKYVFFVFQTCHICNTLLFRNEKELEEGSGNLTLSELELEHAGKYFCAGVNILGVGQEDVFSCPEQL